MCTHIRLPQRLTVALIIAAGILLSVIGWATARADDLDVTPPVAPQLSISISDDLDATDTGETLDYVIRVENIGATDVLGLRVTQSVPDGMAFVSADSSGALKESIVSWMVDVKAADTVSLSTTTTVEDTPADLLRLATVACAHATLEDPPIVCATDSDMLPAGSVAANPTDPADTPAVPQDNETADVEWWAVGGGSALVALLAVLGLVFVRRRRSAGTSPDKHTTRSRDDR